MFSRADGTIAASSSTEGLSLIAGRYVGKDDPVIIVRAQHNFPAVGEVRTVPVSLDYRRMDARVSLGALMPLSIEQPFQRDLMVHHESPVPHRLPLDEME